MKHFLAVSVLFYTFGVFAQEDQEFVTETSCSLSIKVTVFPIDSSDKFGKATIEALLTDNRGNPLPDQAIQMTATNGTFTCMPPVSFSGAKIATNIEGCSKTQEDGTIKIYLIHIPFNRPGTVKAFCTYGSFKVSAVGSYSVTKYTKSSKKSRPKKTRPKKIPISGEI